MTKEEMEKQIHDFAEMMYKTGYEDGYKNGIADGNINDGTFAKKIQEAYENGLNDAWECARKIIGGMHDHNDYIKEERNIIFGTFDRGVIMHRFSASEAIAKIKEYEKQQKKMRPNCSYLNDICPYDVKCEECEIHWSIERARNKVKELKGDKE